MGVGPTLIFIKASAALLKELGAGVQLVQLLLGKTFV